MDVAKMKRIPKNWDEQLLMLDILDLTFPRPHSLKLIALFMGVSWQRVHQIQEHALRKIRMAQTKGRTDEAKERHKARHTTC